MTTSSLLEWEYLAAASAVRLLRGDVLRGGNPVSHALPSHPPVLLFAKVYPPQRALVKNQYPAAFFQNDEHPPAYQSPDKPGSHALN